MDNSNIFVLDSGLDDRYLIYAPLKNILFSCNETAKTAIENNLFFNIPISNKNEKLIKNLTALRKADVNISSGTFPSPTHAVILLSELCNLNCSYCYAQESRSKEILSKEKLKVIVDSVFDEKSNKLREFTFLGGGEPTVTWDLLSWTVEYIKMKSDIHKTKVKIGIATNMTLIDEERAQFIKDNEIAISASFDVLPEIQNNQRAFAISNKETFSTVDKNIKLLIKHGVVPRIRSTITKLNVSLMPEMVEFVANNYPEIKFVHFEHVSNNEINSGDTYYDDFIKNFFCARKIAKKHNIKLKNSIITSTQYIRNNFCSGEFCVTPKGELVSCHRISSDKETLFENVLYGNINNSNIKFDETKMKRVRDRINNISHECKNCFARYHCAGACPYNRYSLNEEQFKEYCRFTKAMIITYFNEQLGLI